MANPIHPTWLDRRQGRRGGGLKCCNEDRTEGSGGHADAGRVMRSGIHFLRLRVEAPCRKGNSDEVGSWAMCSGPHDHATGASFAFGRLHWLTTIVAFEPSCQKLRGATETREVLKERRPAA